MTVIKDYTLVNEEKVKRAYSKELGAGPLATEDQVLAQYAKFGGLIKKLVVDKKDKDGNPAYEVIPHSKFWNFAEKRAVGEKPKVEKPKEENKPVDLMDLKRPALDVMLVAKKLDPKDYKNKGECVKALKK